MTFTSECRFIAPWLDHHKKAQTAIAIQPRFAEGEKDRIDYESELVTVRCQYKWSGAQVGINEGDLV